MLQGARKRTLLIIVISHTSDVARQLEEHSREELMLKKMLLNFFLLSLGNSIAKSINHSAILSFNYLPLVSTLETK